MTECPELGKVLCTIGSQRWVVNNILVPVLQKGRLRLTHSD